jgi:hypothetical protein
MSEEERHNNYIEKNDIIDRNAEKDFLAFFEKYKDEVFYMNQLEVLFEQRYYSWVSSRAIKKLAGKDIIKILGHKEGNFKFVFHKTNRYYKRKVAKIIEVSKEIIKVGVSRDCGDLAELLFENAFLERGFRFIAKHTNEFNGKKWTENDRNMDFILNKDDLNYGFEIKNTFSNIDKDEIDIKIKLCKYIGVIPVFVCRWLPKSYVNDIEKRGSFALFFVSKIFPLNMEESVKRYREYMFEKYGDNRMVCITTKAIPGGIIDRFVKFHEKNKKNM